MDFPNDIDNLLGGEVNAFWTEVDGGAAIPTKPSDIFAQESPYTVDSDWHPFGFTRDAGSYARAIGATAWEVQQSDTAVVRKPTTVTRSVTLSIAELDPSAFEIIEQATETGTVAAIANSSAFDEIGMGSVDSFKRYRIAFVSQRDESAGIVHESSEAVPAAGTRGRFVIGVGFEVSVTADTATLEQARGAMAAVPITFEFFPVSSQPKGHRYGKWWLERAGTIAAT